jgi:hypothetical protein
MSVNNFTIDPNTNVVNVDGDVFLSGKQLSVIPFQFGYVSDNFSVSNCSQLKSLRGSPHTVGGDFQFNSTPVSSLEGIPEIIGGILVMDNTPKLRSLSGIDKHIKEIRGQLWCSSTVTHILGLILINGLKAVDIDSRGPIDRIMNKYLGTGDIISAQDELIDAGLKDQARL